MYNHKTRVIAVIVPVYKVEPYLRECVDSILNQTFKDFELILVDDGSPDNCPAICDEYAKKDNRVIVIHKENGGLSSARNAGLDYVFAHSNSEYISFVDSDDYVDNEMLNGIINLFKNDVDAIKFTYQQIKNNKLCDSFNIDEIAYSFNSFGEKEDFIANDLLQYKIGWEVWSFIFRRSILQNNSLFFVDNNLVYAEDLMFVCEFVACSNSLRTTNKNYYKYRFRKDSITSSLQDSKINEMNNLAYIFYKKHYNAGVFVNEYYYIWYSILNNRFTSMPSILHKKGIIFWKKELYKIEKIDFFKKNILEYKNSYVSKKIYYVTNEKAVMLYYISTRNYINTRIMSILYLCYKKMKKLLCHK